MADGGSRPIKELRPGDRVTATDPVRGTTRPETVVQTITGAGPKRLVDVEVSSTTGVSVIKRTEGRLFWENGTHAWIAAGDLQPGQNLLTESGAPQSSVPSGRTTRCSTSTTSRSRTSTPTTCPAAGHRFWCTTATRCADLSSVVYQVVKGQLTSVEDIAAALRGY